MFISDIAGMDITAHGGDPRTMAALTRNWLVTVSRRKSIPTAGPLLDSFDRFFQGLPDIAQAAGTTVATMAYADYERFVLAWVAAEKVTN